jgi:MFS family permease
LSLTHRLRCPSQGFGLSEFVAGFFFGKISDTYGRWALLLPGSACMAAAMYLTWTANAATVEFCEHVPCDDSTKKEPDFGCPCPGADYTKYYIAAVLYGLTDCAFQTAASAVCAQDFVDSGLAADAFALYRTFQSLGGVIGFGLSPMLSVHGGTTSDPDQLQTELTITAAVGIAALVGLMVYSATPDTARTPITTKDAPLPVAGAYSQAVSAGGFLYLVRMICSHRHV